MGDSGARSRPTAPQSPPHQQHHQGLPSISSLTNGMPLQQRSPERRSTTESLRDSGTSWPMNSKHNSASSGLQVHALLNSNDSPPVRGSQPSTPLSTRPPQTLHSTQQPILPSINQGFQESGNRDSQASFDSRRSSVDSRVHQGFSNLYINNPQSPYESNNASQVSLAASLRRPNGQTPMSPLSGRPPSMRSNTGVAPRVAPQIMPMGRAAGGPNPLAEKPTQGYAWAFPDGPIPEEGRDTDSGDSSTHGMSRKSSLAASSIRSSIFSTDSHMPIGQRRFEDGTTDTHHHTMQHRQIHDLQNENLAGGVGNYSRTPELRVSHKLAERKRRSEMKDLFEDLNKAVPASGGTKASKWEILTKAIEYIRNQQQHERQMSSDFARLQHEHDYNRDAIKENELLKTEVQVMHDALRRLDPGAPHVYGHFTGVLSSREREVRETEARQRDREREQERERGIRLPPIAPSNGTGGRRESVNFVGNGNGNGSAAGAGAAMQGVEYGYAAR